MGRRPRREKAPEPLSNLKNYHPEIYPTYISSEKVSNKKHPGNPFDVDYDLRTKYPNFGREMSENETAFGDFLKRKQEEYKQRRLEEYNRKKEKRKKNPIPEIDIEEEEEPRGPPPWGDYTATVEQKKRNEIEQAWQRYVTKTQSSGIKGKIEKKSTRERPKKLRPVQETRKHYDYSDIYHISKERRNRFEIDSTRYSIQNSPFNYLTGKLSENRVALEDTFDPRTPKLVNEIRKNITHIDLKKSKIHGKSKEDIRRETITSLKHLPYQEQIPLLPLPPSYKPFSFKTNPIKKTPAYQSKLKSNPTIPPSINDSTGTKHKIVFKPRPQTKKFIVEPFIFPPPPQ